MRFNFLSYFVEGLPHVTSLLLTDSGGVIQNTPNSSTNNLRSDSILQTKGEKWQKMVDGTYGGSLRAIPAKIHGINLYATHSATMSLSRTKFRGCRAGEWVRERNRILL